MPVQAPAVRVPVRVRRRTPRAPRSRDALRRRVGELGESLLGRTARDPWPRSRPRRRTRRRGRHGSRALLRLRPGRTHRALWIVGGLHRATVQRAGRVVVLRRVLVPRSSRSHGRRARRSRRRSLGDFRVRRRWILRCLLLGRDDLAEAGSEAVWRNASRSSRWRGRPGPSAVLVGDDSVGGGSGVGRVDLELWREVVEAVLAHVLFGSGRGSDGDGRLARARGAVTTRVLDFA